LFRLLFDVWWGLGFFFGLFSLWVLLLALLRVYWL
jgi:hypothetical protein